MGVFKLIIDWIFFKAIRLNSILVFRKLERNNYEVEVQYSYQVDYNDNLDWL